MKLNLARWIAGAVFTLSPPLQHQAVAAPPLLIEHVTVLPMTADGAALADVTVAVASGRIVSIGAAGAHVPPPGALRIDGRGKWLMPGLTDMHTHLENARLLRLYTQNPAIGDDAVRTEDIVTPYLANGVLRIFDLSAMPETLAQQADIEAGRVPGPHISTAAMIDGQPALLPDGISRSAATPEAGRAAVREAQRQGYQFIKAYGNLDLPTFSAIVDEARDRKLRVVGHIPQRGQGLTAEFFQPGYGLVAHAEEYAEQTAEPSAAAIPAYVELARRNGTWLIATLSLNERILQQVSAPDALKQRAELRYLQPALRDVVLLHNPYVAAASAELAAHLRRVVDFNRQLVRAFTRAGIPVLAGSDSPVPGMVPGFSLHDEMQAMAGAGMSNQQVLAGATRLPAEWLGIAADSGTVETGKRADLLLLDADPTRDIANTRRIAGVIAAGRYFPRAELERRLRALASRYGAE